MVIDMLSRVFAADIAVLDEVLKFIDTELEKHGCPMKAAMQIDVAVEEIFVNICHYAYKSGRGEAELLYSCSAEGMEVTFVDSGVPYNPLERPDPDITLPAEEREIGGLGIFMVKKTMDNVLYEYRDGKNRLTLVKKFT